MLSSSDMLFFFFLHAALQGKKLRQEKNKKIGQIFITSLESAENFTAQNSTHKKPQFLQTPAVFVTRINASSAAQGF